MARTWPAGHAPDEHTNRRVVGVSWALLACTAPWHCLCSDLQRRPCGIAAPPRALRRNAEPGFLVIRLALWLMVALILIELC